jgi:DNA-binding GntR family transcriptional regulator
MNLPQYRKLYIILRDHIKGGIYKEGDILPSENELSSLYNLTRPTVRHALDALVNEGYIKKHQGKGSIVTTPSKEIGILSIQGTTSAIGKDNLKTKIITKPAVKQWKLPFYFDLSQREIELGCIILERIRLVNNKPVFYDITYLPNMNLPRFCNRQFENRSLFEILSKYYHIEVRGGSQKIRAVPADEKISKYLKIKKGKPVLHLERKIETSRNNFVFYSSLYCNTEAYSLFGTF